MSESFIAGLPAALSVQKRLLSGLLAAISADPRWEWLELGCSVAAGRGDELSDLDMGLGYLDPAVVSTVGGILRGLGEVVDVSAQPYNGMDRWWVQYLDGGQIDLVTMPAADRAWRAPGSVALLDRAGRLSVPVEPSALRAGTADPRNWLLDGWDPARRHLGHVRRAYPFLGARRGPGDGGTPGRGGSAGSGRHAASRVRHRPPHYCMIKSGATFLSMLISRIAKTSSHFRS